MSELIYLGKFNKKIKSIEEKGEYIVILTTEDEIYLFPRKSQVKIDIKESFLNTSKQEAKESMFSSKTQDIELGLSNSRPVPKTEF